MKGIEPDFTRWSAKLREFVPSPCIVCSVTTNSVLSLCHHCYADLPWISKSCHTCGIPLPDSGLHFNYCARCLIDPLPFSFCKGLFHYSSPVKKLLARFKFHAQLDIGFTLSNLMANSFLNEYAGISKPDLLLPVPLHRSKLKRRGFNQALEISKVVSRRTAIPLGDGLFEKVKNTQSQAELESAVKRKRNQRGAFSCIEIERLKSVNHIAIIDDVVTTMATAKSLAATIEGQGIRQIDVWCLARATL